jgi:hypothetical protein
MLVFGLPLDIYFFIAIGSLLLWMRLMVKKQATQTAGLSRFIAIYVEHEKTRKFIEPIVFVALGTLVAAGIVQPSDYKQAIAAGFGWTALVSS